MASNPQAVNVTFTNSEQDTELFNWVISQAKIKPLSWLGREAFEIRRLFTSLGKAKEALEIARLFNSSLAQAQLAARAFQFDIIREDRNTPGIYQIENPILGRHWVSGETLRGMGYELPENVTSTTTDGNQSKIINDCEE